MAVLFISDVRMANYSAVISTLVYLQSHRMFHEFAAVPEVTTTNEVRQRVAT